MNSSLRRQPISSQDALRREKDKSAKIGSERRVVEELFTQSLVEKEMLRMKTTAALDKFKIRLTKTEETLEETRGKLTKLTSSPLHSPVRGKISTRVEDNVAITNESFQVDQGSPFNRMRPSMGTSHFSSPVASFPSHPPSESNAFRGNVDALISQRDAALNRITELEKYISTNDISDGDEEERSRVVEALQSECGGMQIQMDKLLEILDFKTNELAGVGWKSVCSGFFVEGIDSDKCLFAIRNDSKKHSPARNR